MNRSGSPAMGRTTADWGLSGMGIDFNVHHPPEPKYDDGFAFECAVRADSFGVRDDRCVSRAMQFYGDHVDICQTLAVTPALPP